MRIIKFGYCLGGRRSDVMCKILRILQGKSADQLLEKYGMKGQTPVKIDQLLKKIGIDVIPADFSSIEEKAGYQQGDILGATLIVKDDVTIFYREDSSENRIRFTVAHELAHCCIHTDKLKETNIQLRQNGKQDDEEKDANVFAGELLIPKENLMKYYEELIVPSLKVLAEIFMVSTSVMAARLDFLALPYYKDTDVSEG